MVSSAALLHRHMRMVSCTVMQKILNGHENIEPNIHPVFFNIKVVVAYWKVKTPCHAHGECIN